MSISHQILTAAQMRSAEQALIAGGISVEALMQRAGRGAADYVWRMAGPDRLVTVLTGPGNNGGDGWVIAEAIRQRGGRVQVVCAHEPKTAAALAAQAAYQGALGRHNARGDILVDCLFGTGLLRELDVDDVLLLIGLAGRHAMRIAIDLPSGVQADSGALLGPSLPDYDLTIALGAWKPAHGLMPACARMGALRLVEIGCAAVEDAGQMLAGPRLSAPPADSHKYRRGLLGVVAGAMSGAALLAARAAQNSGAGYVKVFSLEPLAGPPDLVVARPDYRDSRISALVVGPGLGRDAQSHFALAEAMEAGLPTLLDADALLLLSKGMKGTIATPHEGELVALERHFGLGPSGSKIDRALALAGTSGMVIVAKGPDTVIAAPDGRYGIAPRASSWLSTAGSGDVLAGCIGSRLAAGQEPFTAACEGVWLHGEASRVAQAPFSAMDLAEALPSAYRACL